MKSETLRILLIEPDAHWAELVIDECKAAYGPAAEVQHTAAFHQALEALETTVYDVIVTEIALPKISGLDVVGRIHRRHSYVPVVVHSVVDGMETILNGAHVGVQDYIVKSPGKSLKPLMIAIHYAVSRRHAQEPNIEEAWVDDLTGLYTQGYLLKEWARALAVAHNHGDHTAMLRIDLENLHSVNERFGHETGDKALRTLAERMEACTRVGDSVIRLGGKSFAILISGISDPAEATRVVRTLSAAFREPVVVDDRKLHVGASVGVALLRPDEPAGIFTVMKQADEDRIARRQAKREGNLEGAYGPALVTEAA